jgi:hypothetical protein
LRAAFLSRACTKYQIQPLLLKQFKAFAESRLDITGLSPAPTTARFGRKFVNRSMEARERMIRVVQIEPDYIGPRNELRGDAIDPVEMLFRPIRRWGDWRWPGLTAKVH